ncbi:hypothetical protein [Streptomyces phaeochromogenes]
MTDTTRITVDVLDGPSVRYGDGAYFQGSKAILYTYDLSSAAMRLWLILDDHAQQNRKANPGRKRLGELMNVHPETIDNYAVELKDQGWLIVTPVFDSAGQKSNEYTLTIPQGLNALADDYKRSTVELEVKPKTKMKKTRTTLAYKDTDISPRYALSYNHTREDVPAPVSRGVEKALELSQNARRDAKALESKTPQRKALPAAQSESASPVKKGAPAPGKKDLTEAKRIGTLEAFQREFPRNARAAQRAYDAYMKELPKRVGVGESS